MVCTVSAPVQLLGVGLCGGDAPFTAHLELEEVEQGPMNDDIQPGLDAEASEIAAVQRLSSGRARLGLFPDRDKRSARCNYLGLLLEVAGNRCS